MTVSNVSDHNSTPSVKGSAKEESLAASAQGSISNSHPSPNSEVISIPSTDQERKALASASFQSASEAQSALSQMHLEE